MRFYYMHRSVLYLSVLRMLYRPCVLKKLFARVKAIANAQVKKTLIELGNSKVLNKRSKFS